MVEKIELNIPSVVDVSDYEVGVLVARMQVPKLHDVHRHLVDTVCANHKKVIIFLGVPVVEQTKRNPLDFASRKSMIQKEYPDVTILPLRDQRDNNTWSEILDYKIQEPFGDRTTLLYGARDSFIPFYKGKYQTVELIGNNDQDKISGSSIREEVAREVGHTEDFRKGVIYANYGRHPVIMPCVDVVVLDKSNNTILLGRKPSEDKFRFIGGHVDVTDVDYESAGLRELGEEAGRSLEVGKSSDGIYICSGKIKDWRHQKEDSEIFSTLYLYTKQWGHAKPADDIEEVRWVPISDLLTEEQYSKFIISEHIEFFSKLVSYFKSSILETETK
jgi:bifunctional NMN adenylyltransferase/nudix hydrolase